MLNREASGKRWRVRPDGPGKVTGRLAYLTDMSAPGMLHGMVLRSPHPHARIVSIDTGKAEGMKGVYAVLTHRDIPGLNGFGIAVQDQPVLCGDRVRYVGDAVAAVAAESLEQAELALQAVEVVYEALPVIDDPERALDEDAPLLHPGGNALHRTAYRQGDVEAGFRACRYIVEETYVTPRQMHAYMETEGGLFVPEDGRLTVYSPTQHGFMDRLQLSRILAKPQNEIRVISSPIGGSFGGKDELNIQSYGSLLAMRTGRPVKIHNSRWESVRSGLKRHPMKITMKTGVDDSGKIMAHQVKMLADTGPYATLGAEVLNFATEHVTGPYIYGSVDVEGVSAFTNNGMSGELRGFGGNQAIFALEGQMDRLAEGIGMDPWAFRLHNVRQPGDPGPLGQPVVKTDGVMQVWEALADSQLWKEREDGPEADGDREPWIKTGIGASLIMHGSGLGVGIPDPAGGRLKLAPDGKIEAVFGYEEFGQGLIASLELMLMEQFGLAADDIRIVIGDTDAVPDSGSTTASRATSMMWKSLQNLGEPFTAKLLETAGRLTGADATRLRLGEQGIRDRESGELVLAYTALAEGAGVPLETETKFHFPTSPVDRIGAHFIFTYSAVAVKAEVNTLTGRVRILRQFHAVAAGPVVNPQGYLGQIEGGSSMALGYALTEDAVMEGGHYVTKNMDTYLIPTIAEHTGPVEVLPIEAMPADDPHGPRGVGEIGSVTVAPAIASAIRHAVGKWISRLPVEPELLQERPSFLRQAVRGE